MHESAVICTSVGNMHECDGGNMHESAVICTSVMVI